MVSSHQYKNWNGRGLIEYDSYDTAYYRAEKILIILYLSDDDNQLFQIGFLGVVPGGHIGSPGTKLVLITSLFLPWFRQLLLELVQLQCLLSPGRLFCYQQFPDHRR